MVNRPIKVVLLSLSAILLITGCWDRQEIEKRGIVLGVAIDKVPESEAQGILNGEPGTPQQNYEVTPDLTPTTLYRMTLQFPVIKRAKPPGTAGGGGGGGGQEPAVWNISGVGVSPSAIEREMTTRVTIIPFFEHLQTLVISEDAAREGISKFMDFFFRDPEMRRRTRIFVSHTEARKVLEVVPEIEDYTAIYLNDIPLGARENARIESRLDLGQLSKALHNGNDIVIPGIIPQEREVKVNGAAVFKKDQMVGWITEDETEALRYVAGFFQGDWLTVPCPLHPPGPITVEINRAEVKNELTVKDGKPSFDVKLNLGGNLAEDLCQNNDKDYDPEFLRRVGEQVAQTLEQRIHAAMQKVQGMKADVGGLGLVVQRKDPHLWNQIKDRWGDEIYPTVEVRTEVQVQLRLVGLGRKAP